MQGLHGLEAMSWKIETEYLPYTNQVEIRFIPERKISGHFRAMQRSWRSEDVPPNWAKLLDAKMMRASLDKRRRHAKRPNGRR